MRIRTLAAACAAATVTCVTLACKDMPFLPKWDADWYVPLTSQGVVLLGPFAATVPPGTSANVSFTPLQQSLDGTIGSVLREELSNASIIVQLTKTVPISGADTLFLASGPAAVPSDTIPVSFAASDVSKTDTVALSGSGLAMIRNQAQSSGSIYVLLSGRVSYAGPGNLNITSSDSIGVKLALLATIAVSR